MDYAQSGAVGIVSLTRSIVYTELSGSFCTFESDRKSSPVRSCLSLPFDVMDLVMDRCLIQRGVFEGAPSPTLEHTSAWLARSPACSESDRFDVPGSANMARPEQLDTPSRRLLQNSAICRPKRIKVWKKLGLKGSEGDTAARAVGSGG